MDIAKCFGKQKKNENTRSPAGFLGSSDVTETKNPFNVKKPKPSAQKRHFSKKAKRQNNAKQQRHREEFFSE